MLLDDTLRTGRTTAYWMHLGTAVLILMSLVLAALPTPTLAAQPFVVNRVADGIDRNVGDGVCDASPAAGIQCSLRAAVMEANAQPSANVITLPAGTYLLVIPGEDEDGAAAGDLDVTDTLSINGAHATTTIVDADELDRVFQVHDAAGVLSLARLTLQNGRSLTGGGILAVGTSVRLTNSTVRANRGVGIELHNSTLDTVFTALRDNWGSGIAAYEGSSIRLVRNTLTSNQGDYGGAMYVEASTATLVNSVINGNIADHDGGGIYLASGALNLFNTTVATNDAGRASDYDDLDAGYGGGLFIAPGATATVKNSILANNGYWIFFEETGSMYNPQECAGTLVSQGYNLVETECTLSGDTATNIVGKDPRLVRAKTMYPGGTISYYIDTLALSGDSPAIDTANPGGCVDDKGTTLSLDLRGALRPVNGNAANGTILRCDMGAYEFAGPLISNINPASIVAGASTFTVTVNGQRFTTASVVRWNNVNRPTTFVNANQLTVTLHASDRKQAGKAAVTVFTSGVPGGYSNPKTFTITAP